MRLDIVIPCAGSGAFIAETLASVVPQLRPQDQIYVVDNASAHSRYREEAAKLPAAAVTYLRFENRLGMTRNWQRCLDVGTGDACLLLNDDDLLSGDAIATGMDFLAGDKEVTAALLPRIPFETGSLPRLSDAAVGRETKRMAEIDALPETSRSLGICLANVHHMSALFFRRKAIGFYPQMRWTPDQGFIFAQAIFGRVALASRGAAFIRLHPASLTNAVFSGNGRTLMEERDLMKMVIDAFIEERGLRAVDFIPLAPIIETGVLRRVLQACFSWPWRRSRLVLGRNILRTPELKVFVRRNLGFCGIFPLGVAGLTALASEVRALLVERPATKS